MQGDFGAILLASGTSGLAAIVASRELRWPIWLTLAIACSCLAAAVVVAGWLHVAIPSALLLGALLLCCLAIAEIDRRSYIIPDLLTLAIFLLSFGAPTPASWEDRVLGAGLLGLLFYSVHAGFSAPDGRPALGLGDVKLAAAMGAVLGLELGLVAVAIAGVSTLLVMSAGAVRQGLNSARTQAAPFGVGLSTALMLVAAAGTGLGA